MMFEIWRMEQNDIVIRCVYSGTRIRAKYCDAVDCIIGRGAEVYYFNIVSIFPIGQVPRMNIAKSRRLPLRRVGFSENKDMVEIGHFDCLPTL